MIKSHFHDGIYFNNSSPSDNKNHFDSRSHLDSYKSHIDTKSLIDNRSHFDSSSLRTIEVTFIIDVTLTVEVTLIIEVNKNHLMIMIFLNSYTSLDQKEVGLEPLKKSNLVYGLILNLSGILKLSHGTQFRGGLST